MNYVTLLKMNSLKTYVLRSHYDYGLDKIDNQKPINSPPSKESIIDTKTVEVRNILDVTNNEQPEEFLIVSKFEEEFSKLIERLESVQIQLNGDHIDLPNGGVIYDAYNVIIHLMAQNLRQPKNLASIIKLIPDLHEASQIDSNRLKLGDVTPWITLKDLKKEGNKKCDN